MQQKDVVSLPHTPQHPSHLPLLSPPPNPHRGLDLPWESDSLKRKTHSGYSFCASVKQPDYKIPPVTEGKFYLAREEMVMYQNYKIKESSDRE